MMKFSPGKAKVASIFTHSDAADVYFYQIESNR